MHRWVGTRRAHDNGDLAEAATPKLGRPEVGVLAASMILRSALGRGLGGAREAGLAVLTVPGET